LMNTLKPPTVAKVELDLGGKENSAIDALRQATMALVAQQQLALGSGGMSAKQVAEMQIIEAEVVHV